MTDTGYTPLEEQKRTEARLRMADAIGKAKVQHTPGRWEHDHENPGGVPWITQGNDRIAILDSTLPYPEVDANARLIAAAPELLEALGRIIGGLEVGTTLTWETSAIDQARAAIAEARGEG